MGERGGGRGEEGGRESRSMGSFHTSINNLVQPSNDKISRENTQIMTVTRNTFGSAEKN